MTLKGGVAMLVRVLIKRTVKREKEAALVDLVTKLRSLASTQPGYISGETMRSAYKPDKYLVISTWRSIADWEKWFKSKKRSTIQDKIDKLLGKKTAYEVYQYPEKSASLRKFKGYEGEAMESGP